MSEPVDKTEPSPSSPSDKPEQSSSSDNLEQSSSPPTSPLPPTQQEKDCQAFVSWIRAVVSTTDDDQRTLPQHPRDLADGAWLSRVLSDVDAQHFRNPHSSGPGSSNDTSKDNYVMRIGTLNRLHKQVDQYYTDTLHQSIEALPSPDLDEIARSSSPAEIAKLCKLAIGITIQSNKTKTSHIAAIQTLSQADQHSLMLAIEGVMSGVVRLSNSGDADADAATPKSASHQQHSSEEDDAHHRAITALRKEKDELHAAYLSLIEQHDSLKVSHEDSQTEKHELNKEIERLHEEAQRSRATGAEAVLKADLESLKTQLRKSEDSLAEAELEVDRLTKVESDLSKKMSDLQSQADAANKLKDQMDEYRHMADKAQRTENALEKYKKKLEESAAVRRQLKSLEEQNSELIDRNASLERDYAKLADFKPLMDNYKGQIDDLNAKNARLNEDLTTAGYNLEQSTLQVKALEEARSKDAEELQLYSERVQELELGNGGHTTRRNHRGKGRISGQPNEGAEGLAANDDRADFDDDGDDVLVDDELEDALQGTTMTDLKLRVHQLSRDLKAAKRNKADSSRILVLENLLQDSQRLAKKYEDDYWREYKSRLQLSGEMDKIRSGATSLGDGTEAAYALRLRVNELVSECSELKKAKADLDVKYEANERELTIARSDLSLVNKDQLDVLSSLRASVSSEKTQLEEQVSNLKNDVASAQEDSRKLGAQIQTLLMDKINLMEGGWSDREDALKREREVGELRTSLAGKSLPPDVEEMIVRLSTSNKDVTAQLTALQDRMSKAKTFIRQQDKLLKEAEARAAMASSAPAPDGPDDEHSKTALAKENAKLKREQEMMLSAWHHLALSKGYLSGSGQKGRERQMDVGAPVASTTADTAGGNEKSWLGKEQRARMGVRSILGRS